MTEIVGHLVDEARLAGSVDLGVAEVFLGERGEDVRRQIGEDAGIARIVDIRVAPLQIEYDPRDIGQLLSAFDLRVGCQNLLDQGRA